MFQYIKDFKAELSVSTEAVLDIPELDIAVRMTRAQFEALIADQLDQVRQALDDTLTSARLQATDIDIVLGTGGSSLIPAVRDILEARFPGRVVEHDPFTSVAAGSRDRQLQSLVVDPKFVLSAGFCVSAPEAAARRDRSH